METIYLTLKVPIGVYACYTFSHTGERAACITKENAFSYDLVVVAAWVWHAKWLYLLGSCCFSQARHPLSKLKL